jgi:threonine dehydratase
LRANFDAPDADVYLKFETLQPIGSFKLRGAANAMLSRGAAALAAGVWTPSAGNMAQGVAWMARRLGVACRSVVPETAPRTKLDALARLGAQIVSVPFDAWWKAMLDGAYPAAAPDASRAGILVHPVADVGVIAGNGTIGLEILADLPDVDAVLVPFGGGGLITGIASALRGRRPSVRVIACEIETGAPLGPSLRAVHRPKWHIARRSSMASAARASCRACGRACNSWSMPRSRSGSRKPQQQCGSSPRASGSSPRALAPCRSRRRSLAWRARQDRLRRLGRQHRSGEPGDDSGRRRSRILSAETDGTC